MRGKLDSVQIRKFAHGITPADAGKTSIFTVRQADTEDHPRGCGENGRSQAGRRHRLGSPPRMRGKRTLPPLAPSVMRITPADAGKTCLCWALRRNYWDHPRGCGENPSCPKPLLLLPGSPPRMRGKPRHCMYMLTGFRITPADAGKTASLSRMLTAWWDHPRGCGENVADKSHGDASMGSPPRMRGKRRENQSWLFRDRITPADAGKTSFGSRPPHFV